MPDIDDLTPNELVTQAGLTSNEVQAIWKEAEKIEPELWKTCYPRIYKEYKPNVYYSPKVVSQEMFSITKKIELGYFGQSEQYEMLWANNMAARKTPLYWASPEITQAVMQTKPPVEIDWYNMELPFEAAAFMLPKGTMAHAKDGEVQYITYYRSRKQKWVKSIARRGPKEFASENGAFCVLVKTAQFFTHFNLPYDHYPVLNLKDIDEALMRHEDQVHSSGWLSSPTMDREDTRIGIQATHLIFGFLLLMLRKPELVTGAKLINKVKGKAGKPDREFWAPAVIGENYRIRRVGPVTEGQGGTHASPRGHWVRGFWNTFHYGPQRAMMKEQWIEPYWRGGEEAA